ncbi:uncharacterized protein LOC128675289 [Plodia interpunctella]|uniref:uncharacterized protein LOC128675289 n=1 Tax=Plodia interpunctella TaxID=58824 RepID=UPI00236748AF|nr:uncharacterized protein LOC128675289 [Plodia interpunctella]
MSTPATVRVNTLMQCKEKPYTDPITKFYIVIESIIALNRLPLIFTKYVSTYFPIAMIYSLIVICGLCYSYYGTHLNTENGATSMNHWEYMFCVGFGIATWKRLQRYYIELNKFDVEVGCRPKITTMSVRNTVINIITLFFVTVFYVTSYYVDTLQTLWFHMLPVHYIHSLELHYYGHLLSLLATRLRLINYYTESSLSDIKMTTRPKVEEFVYFKYKNVTNGEMKKLMDLYHSIIMAYDFLVDAIKWQLLVIIITSFISILWLAYHVSLSIIRNSDPLVYIVTDVGLTITKMLPLFSPCVFGDRVHSEVRRLRELLASRLYENKLDKSSRSTARALLALTEARDLSFSLLRMLEIDVSFPFKFIGLLITYLIILLQFEKVINP